MQAAAEAEDVVGDGNEDIDKELKDFDNEYLHKAAFTSRGLTCLSCFAYTLQLVVIQLNKSTSAKEHIFLPINALQYMVDLCMYVHVHI